MSRIAIIGSGISGLAAGYLLSRRHEVHLFERDGRLGGHTHTVVVDTPTGPLPLDTGFLVHNDRTYPNLIRLFRETGVETQWSDMSFSVTCPRTGLEYSSRGISGFFAQRRNLVSPAHLRLLRSIMRFNKRAPLLLEQPGAERVTLGDYLADERYDAAFEEHYLFPMASAIWSASFDGIRAFPAVTLIRFFQNHGMLGLTTSPKWKVVTGGSHSYIPKLVAPFADHVHTGAPVRRVERTADGVVIHTDDAAPFFADEVVFACHGDQVLPLLADASPAEREVMGAFRTTANDTWLHTDGSLLPRTPDAHASWNYLLGDAADEPPTLTYSLNRLQSIPGPTAYCVTLNPRGRVDASRLIRRIDYRHPQYTLEAIRAQARWAEVSGLNRTHFCGAYWFYGFHEDGLNSAIRVAGRLGVEW